MQRYTPSLAAACRRMAFAAVAAVATVEMSAGVHVAAAAVPAATPPATVSGSTATVGGPSTAGGTQGRLTAPPKVVLPPVPDNLPPATGEKKKQAELLFGRYVDLEHAFDVRMVELYSPEAKVQSTIVVPGKPTRLRTWDGKTYRDLLGRALRQASKQDVSYYSGMIYLQQGDMVRIKVQRFAKEQNLITPMELLVGPDLKGHWLIFEERSETHPPLSAPPPPAN